MILQWINTKFNLELDENNLVSVKNFSLIWNIYENLVSGTNFSIPQVEASYSTKEFDRLEIEPFFEYFRDRYISEGSTNERFNHLNFRANDREEFVRSVLLEETTGINNKVLAITIIIYRFRNNLFHGLKNFREINQQESNFENANSFLTIILNHY